MQIFQLALHRIGTVVARHAVRVEFSFRFASRPCRFAFDRAGRDADDGGIRGNRVDHDGIGTDASIIAHGNGSEHLGSGADDDVVAHGRMAFATAGAGDAEGDLMIDIAVTGRLGVLADHDSHAVIDDESAPEFGGGMNLDAGQPARYMRGESSKKIQVVGPKPMRQAMPNDRMQAWVAKQYFDIGTSRGSALSIAADGLTEEHVSHATFPL